MHDIPVDGARGATGPGVRRARWACLGWAGWFSTALAAIAAPHLVVTPDTAWQDGPCPVVVRRQPAGTEVLATTNGSAPTASNGIPVSVLGTLRSTTIVRAAAFRDGTRVGEPAMASLLFAGDVLAQRGDGFPGNWGTKEGKPVPAYYGFAPEAVRGAGAAAVLAALRALPVLSIAMDPADLFGSGRGIYANPEQSGEAWEREAAVQFVAADGTRGFATGAGLRIQGGWNRRPEESPKHSMRLVFRKRYGARELRHPLFGAGVDRFETLVLRGGNNHSWLHWSGEERRTADYLRDPWMRETYGLMGHLSARSRFVHVFLNGLYWGVYNLAERPDAHFVAARRGGAPGDHDARNADKVLSGDEAAWRELFALANGGAMDAARYAGIGALLDLPAFCDYMLLNFYGANGDWDASSNWYATRPRRPGGKFEFIVWDGERTLENPADDRMADDSDLSPLRLFQKLRAWPGFREEFASRASRHLAADGLLGAKAAGERYRALSEALAPAIAAEAARWGDYRRTVHAYKEGPYERYTVEGHWRPEVRRLLGEYFPRRTEVFAGQLHAAGFPVRP